MRKTKGFMIGAIFFYVWYVYTSAVYHFADFYTTDVLYKVLKISAPLTLLGKEAAAGGLFYSAPILFFLATVVIDLLPEFTKKQKILLTVMPIVSYALLWAMDFIYSAYFSFWAFH